MSIEDKDEIEQRIKYATDIATMQRDIHHMTLAQAQTAINSAHQTQQIEALSIQIQAIKTILSEAKGGWKTLVIVGTFVSAITASITGWWLKVSS